MTIPIRKHPARDYPKTKNIPIPPSPEPVVEPTPAPIEPTPETPSHD